MSNHHLQFDFLVDKGNNSLTVRREFAAERRLVWDCYTKSELLEQWFAPSPWKARTKTMNFCEGGFWLYAMCGPAGEEHWGRMDYLSIQPTVSFAALDGFCDADGNLNPALPQASWESAFSDLSGNTLVETVVVYNSLEDLETVLQMGMKEGLTIAMEGLDELLSRKKSLLFEFTVDKAAKTVFIQREFAAEQSLVWDAFTKAALLDQWVAPAPYTAKTKYMNFQVGGRRFYAMISPEGAARWAIQEYTSITPKTNFKMWNAFADKDETPELPGSEWDYHFSEQNGITRVSISIYNESFERMERLLDGFKQGFTATLKNLENLLTTL